MRKLKSDERGRITVLYLSSVPKRKLDELQQTAIKGIFAWNVIIKIIGTPKYVEVSN